MATNDLPQNTLQDQDHEALKMFDTWLVGSVHSDHNGVQLCTDSALRDKIHQLCETLTIIDKVLYKSPQLFILILFF